MLKANELRIGNWVSHVPSQNKSTKANFIVSEINMFDANSINGLEALDCEPIIITSELYNEIQSQLLKKVSYGFSNNHITIYIADYEFKFNYLHSLQNFFFALTGEELQLSSNVA